MEKVPYWNKGMVFYKTKSLDGTKPDTNPKTINGDSLECIKLGMLIRSREPGSRKNYLNSDNLLPKVILKLTFAGITAKAS